MSATPWEEAEPLSIANEPAPPRQKRQARKPREASRHPPGHDGRDLPEAPQAAGRKPRAEREAPDTIKVTIKEFAEMRVGAEDAKLFVKLHGTLSELTKASRVRLLAELTKVLG